MNIQTVKSITADKNYWVLLVSLSVIVASVIIPPDFKTNFDLCIFKRIFHFPCPGCGMTRGFFLLGHLRIKEALAMNINSLPAFLILIAIAINEIIFHIFGRRISLQLSANETIITAAIFFIITMSGWYFNLMFNSNL